MCTTVYRRGWTGGRNWIQRRQRPLPPGLAHLGSASHTGSSGFTWGRCSRRCSDIRRTEILTCDVVNSQQIYLHVGTLRTAALAVRAPLREVLIILRFGAPALCMKPFRITPHLHAAATWTYRAISRVFVALYCYYYLSPTVNESNLGADYHDWKDDDHFKAETSPDRCWVYLQVSVGVPPMEATCRGRVTRLLWRSTEAGVWEVLNTQWSPTLI